MEINFQIYRAKRFVHVALLGDMEYQHLHGLLNQIVSLGVLDFRSLYDARGMRPRFGAYDLQMLKVRLGPLARSCPLGASAFVVDGEEAFALFQMCELLMQDVWSVHPCHNVQEAMKWLDSSHPWTPATRRVAA